MPLFKFDMRWASGVGVEVGVFYKHISKFSVARGEWVGSWLCPFLGNIIYIFFGAWPAMGGDFKHSMYGHFDSKYECEPIYKQTNKLTDF